MKIKWWGHASFLITDSEGNRLLTDPYPEEIGYNRITDEADIITVSHDHFDHNAFALIGGNPRVVSNSGIHKFDNITIEGIESYHDTEKGNERGKNIIYFMQIDDMYVAHLGDLGHLFKNDGKLDKLKKADILLIPVGGHYTIDAEQAYIIVCQLNAKVIIPMHYKTEVLDFPIAGVEEFTGKFDPETTKIPDSNEIKINDLPSALSVYVLDFVQ